MFENHHIRQITLQQGEREREIGKTGALVHLCILGLDLQHAKGAQHSNKYFPVIQDDN